MNWVFYVLLPVLIHLILSEGVTVLTGNLLDSAACTALSAVLVLPVAIYMYRRDTVSRSIDNSGGATNRKLQDEDGVFQHKTRRKMQRLGCYMVYFLSGGLLNLLWSGILYGMGISSAFSNQTQEALLSSQMAMQLLGPGFLVPIAEELIFRGLVYKRMKTRLSVGQAVFFSALLFALYHGNPIQMIYAFPMALLLALLYDRDGSLAVPILFHMGANLTAIFFS
ncbi:MAG: CPBP family intramembrane metalloprotease [Lachnospiraceae bacterium]|nr:CPBP family intramembrane metalloprotease [Lachnospiraceae bacterium]